MARPKKQDSGERRTAFVGFQVTPSERATLEQGAARKAATLSQHARELCLRRANAVEIVVAGTSRNPEAAALIAELTAIGNNLNQLAKRAHIDRATPQEADLRATTDRLKAAFVRVLKL